MKSPTDGSSETAVNERVQFSHGEDGSYQIQGGYEDADLADTSCQQEGPRGFSVGLCMAEDLRGDNGCTFIACSERIIS